MSDLRKALEWLAKKPDVLFVGQGVGVCGGTRMSALFDGVPPEKRWEFPVAEELQCGVALGLSLEGFVPVAVFPRMNFLLRAMDQLVNHLDRLPLYSDYRPRVIVLTSCVRGALDAGPQHSDDLTDVLGLLLKTVTVHRLGADCLGLVRRAYASTGSTVLVESAA